VSRADLLALTPASVAALANLGLVKRAQREIEAGKAPALEEDDAGLVTGTFEDGVVTRLPPGVPLRDAPCSCGSTTVCRHRVAVVLAYPSWFARNEGPTSRKAPEPVVEAWSPSCFADAELAALVGKRVMTRAQSMLRAGVVVELEGGATPVAKLPTCAVRFHVPRDLAYARCDCQASIACEHVVVASWAFRQADAAGTPAPCTVELGTTKAATSGGPPLLADALALAEHVIVSGVAHLGDADKPRFAKVRASLAKDGMLWPGAIVDDLEMMLEAYRARSARYRTGEAVFLLASLEARARAAKRGGALPARFLLGSDEARETLLDHVRLISLGARIEADGDRREASVYLADPDSGVVLVASREFAPPSENTSAKTAEPEEGPALARRVITGRTTLGALARGQLVTRAAKRHANHALSLGTARTGQTSVAPSSGDWDCLPEGLLVRSAGRLLEDLRARPPRLLRTRTLAAEMKVFALEPGAVVEIAYRPGDQELVAVLGQRDPTTGEMAHVHLVRRHSRAGPSALDALARALASNDPAPRFVAGDVRLGPRGIEVDPTAIVTDRVIVPDLEVEPSIVETLPFLATRKETPLHAAIAVAATVLEEGLHDGLGRSRTGFADRAAHAASALGAVGLAGARERMLALGNAVKSSDVRAARAWLDAAVRLELSREAAR
jgi:hypothetical protein